MLMKRLIMMMVTRHGVAKYISISLNVADFSSISLCILSVDLLHDIVPLCSVFIFLFSHLFSFCCFSFRTRASSLCLPWMTPAQPRQTILTLNQIRILILSLLPRHPRCFTHPIHNFIDSFIHSGKDNVYRPRPSSFS